MVSRSRPGFSDRWVASSAAACRRAGLVLAERWRARAPRRGEAPGVRLGLSSSPLPTAAGGASSITCALVPEMPKELTPARRGRPFGSQGWASPSNSTLPASQSTLEEG